MSIIAFVTERPIVDKMLAHLGLLEGHSHSPPQEVLPVEELTYQPCYDDFPFEDSAYAK